MVQEGHVHSSPEGKDEEQALARRLGYTGVKKQTARDLFWKDHRTHTTIARSIFDRLFYGAQKEIADGAPKAGTIWNDLDRPDLIIDELDKIGFSDAAKAYENLLALREGEVSSPPSPKRLKVMRTLGPALIAEIAESSAPDRALLNLSGFSHRIGGRTGFLTLLAENPETMRLLITLFADSQFLTDLFLNRPELIDTLITIDEIQERFGCITKGRFAILGMGKMGGRELDYNSDLDLVFIYDADDDAQSRGGSKGILGAHEFYVRVGQKLITYLSAATEE